MTPAPNDSTRIDDGRLIRRLIPFTVVATVFWSVVLLLTYEHESGLAYVLLTLLALAIMYMLAAICRSLWVSPEADIQRDPPQYEMTDTAGLTAMSDAEHDDDGVRGSIHDISLFRFDETQRRVRACREVVIPGLAPRAGTYKVVYVAIVFGKQVRSQGHLHLQFTPCTTRNSVDTSKPSSLPQPCINNGWELSGTSTFGSSSATIKEGFVNAEGQIYWIVPTGNLGGLNHPPPIQAVMYRGVLDLESCTLDNGEFQSISLLPAAPNMTSTVSLPSGDRRMHEGRIVRMERVAPKDGQMRSTHDLEPADDRHVAPEIV